MQYEKKTQLKIQKHKEGFEKVSLTETLRTPALTNDNGAARHEMKLTCTWENRENGVRRSNFGIN